jgi:hypothetical protein
LEPFVSDFPTDFVSDLNVIPDVTFLVFDSIILILTIFIFTIFTKVFTAPAAKTGNVTVTGGDKTESQKTVSTHVTEVQRSNTKRGETIKRIDNEQTKDKQKTTEIKETIIKGNMTVTYMYMNKYLKIKNDKRMPVSYFYQYHSPSPTQVLDIDPLHCELYYDQQLILTHKLLFILH